jgi:hypothetical protein
MIIENDSCNGQTFTYIKNNASGNTVEKNGAFNFLQHLIQKIEKYYMFWLLW